MNPRLLLLAIVPLGIAFALLREPDSSVADAGPTKVSRTPQFLGAGSCSASACHNANFAKGHTGSEYTLWITRDPHAKAYETLFGERSLLMQKNLRSPMSAHEDPRCLKCHVAPDYDVKQAPPVAPYFKTDGVSCESCHGPAKNWAAFHHLASWQLKTPAQKKSLGMKDTQSLAGRAQVCVTCHVGAPGMEVDHDLIAAGHPRLHFEFAAFHDAMPRHWPDFKDRDATKSARGRPDFEARAWLVGQLVTAHAALELLADRAAEKPWPEFAEYDCAACHHDLQSPSARQKSGYGKRKPGVLPWGHYLALSPLAIETLAGEDAQALRDQLRAVQKIMDAGNPRRDGVADAARRATVISRTVLRDLDQRLPHSLSLQARLQTFVEARGADLAPTADWLTQVQLSHAALRKAARDLRSPGPAELPKAIREGLPLHFDPQAIKQRLLSNSKKGS